MAGKRQRSTGVWELCFERKGLLPRTYRTFDTQEEALAYEAQVERLLDKGIVPMELVSSKLQTIGALIELYGLREVLAPSSRDRLQSLYKAVGSTKTQALTNQWLDNWIESMKANLAPSTIKKNVELLARCVDWAMRRDLVPLTKNPMRQLPRGYAGRGNRHDTWDGQRSRRLSEDGAEERAIRKTLVKKEECLFFAMALETAMRMREMYTLTVDQVDVNRQTIFLEKTKNGSKRQVPMTSVLKALLLTYLPTLEDERLFPWWDGVRVDDAYLNTISSKVSQRFARRFKEAKVIGLRFHDLRHCATSRIYERTTLTDLEIASITGHSDPRMLKRYANLRGSNLAKKLW